MTSTLTPTERAQEVAQLIGTYHIVWKSESGENSTPKKGKFIDPTPTSTILFSLKTDMQRERDYHISFRPTAPTTTTTTDGPDFNGMFQYAYWKDVFTARYGVDIPDDGRKWKIWKMCDVEWEEVEHRGLISAEEWGRSSLVILNEVDENGNKFLMLWFQIGGTQECNMWAKKAVAGVTTVLTEEERVRLQIEPGDEDEDSSDYEEEEEEQEEKEEKEKEEKQEQK
ncbi:hypothetical protein MMC12_003226 [Toensbergia leucococca]|nr:hypothetical protein [Toensbergia leucococca]